MKVLLFTTPWSYRELSRPDTPARGGGKVSSDISGQGILPPLGLLYVSSAVEKAGHEAIFIDGYMKSPDEIAAWAEKVSPDVIGISAPTCLWEKTRHIIRLLRQRTPGSFIILGGPHASLEKERCLYEAADLDAVATGDGEPVMTALLPRLEKSESLGGIPGLIFRKDGTGDPVIQPETLTDPDCLPFPAYHLLDLRSYVSGIVFLDRLPFAHVMTSRGCMYRCSYCAAPGAGRARFRSPEKIAEEVSLLSENFGVRTINFYDDCSLFSADSRKASELCRKIRDAVPGIRWSLYLTDFGIDPSLLKEMKESGCCSILCAIESGVEKNRRRVIGHGDGFGRITHVLEEARRRGIQTCGRFQVGIPGETRDEALGSVRYALNAPLDYAFFVRAFAYPGSETFRYYREMGRVSSDSRRWNAYADFYEPDGMTSGEVREVMRAGYMRFYLRPSWAGRRISDTKRWRLYAKYIKRVLSHSSA